MKEEEAEDTMDWRRLSHLLREEGRFEDERKLRRRVGDLVTDDAVHLVGPLEGKDADAQLADAARRLRLLNTPYANDLAEDAEDLADVPRRLVGTPEDDADDDAEDIDDDDGGGWFKG